MATAKHKIQHLVFNPAKLKLLELLGELQKLAKDAFGVAVQAIIEQFLYAKMPPHLKKLVNQGHLENSTFEQIVRHLEKELELNSLEAPDELQMNTMTQKQQTRQQKNTGSINSDADNYQPKNIKNYRTSKTVCLPCGICGNTNFPAEKSYYRANAANRPFPWKSKPAVQNGPHLQEEQNNITKSVIAAAQVFNWSCHVFTPELDVTDWKLPTS